MKLVSLDTPRTVACFGLITMALSCRNKLAPTANTVAQAIVEAPDDSSCLPSAELGPKSGLS